MPFGVEEIEGDNVDFNEFLDPVGNQVSQISAISGTQHVLTYVDGLRKGDSIKYVGTTVSSVGVIFNVNTADNIISFEAAVTGSPGDIVLLAKAGSKATSTDFYIKAPVKDYSLMKAWALYSADIDCAPTYYGSIISGNKLGISTNLQSFTSSQVNAVDGRLLH